MAIDLGRIEAAVSELLSAIGDDPTRPGLVDTPRRVAESYAEFFAGLGQDAAAPLRDGMTVDALGSDGVAVGVPAGLGELVILRDIAFRSMCEHHLLPFTGVIHLGYLPGGRVVGLGRLPKVVDILSSRPQLQERLTEQLADALVDGLDPEGVLVVVDARHQCVAARGPRQSESTTVTMATRGALSDPVRRAEAVALISGKVVS